MDNYPYIDIHNHVFTAINNNSVSICSFFVQGYEYSENQDNIYFTVGLHPWHVDNVNLPQILPKIEEIAKLASCIGIGEIGLDRVASASFEKQLAAFEAQVIQAKKLALPVIIHNVRCLQEIQQVLKQAKFDLPVVFHGFTGKIEMAKQILSFGNSYLSFGKSILVNKDNKILNLLPLDRIFFETDESELGLGKSALVNKDGNMSNLLASNSFSIKANESQIAIEEIYNVAALLLNKPVEILKQRIYNNFITVFNKYNA